MEGNGPGNGFPKELGVILSGHSPFLVDLLCSKLIGYNYKRIPFLKIALKKGHLTTKDIEQLKQFKKIVNFRLPKKTIFARLLLNNFFIGIRFMKPFQRIFDRGFVPWFLFKLGVRQDIYIHKERDIKRFYNKENATLKEKQIIQKCLEKYCPLNCDKINNNKCIQCMYCYQILPDLIKYEGNLGAFKMQLDRFGKYLKNGR